MSLQGMIEEMGLGEVIQALSLNRHRGTLRIETDEGASKFFYLSEGEIVLIRTVRSEPLRIGELLLRAGKLKQADLQSALTLQKETNQRLGEVLIALGFVAGSDVDEVVRGKFEQEFLDAFLIDRGRFEFVFGLSPETLFSPEEKLERIALNTQGLMLEAMRRVDDWQKMLKELGSLDEIYRARSKDVGVEDYSLEGVALAPSFRREVFDAIDGRRTIRDVLAIAQERGASRLAAFAFLRALKQENLVEPLDGQECLAEARASLEAEDAEATAKFLRAVMAKEKIEIALVRKYIEFLKKNPKSTFARSECKNLANSYLANDEIDHAIALFHEALEIDPRDAEVLDRLFYSHLRKNDLEEALAVGYRFREFMQRDTDLPAVARVVKNMRELAPEDWRVLELSGLLLKRQDRPDEARRELEKALAGAKSKRAPGERQAGILEALIEIDPQRSSLAKEREQLLRNALIAEAQMRARRVLALVLLLVGLVLISWFASGEFMARRELVAADAAAEGASDAAGRLRALELYRQAAQRVSTVSHRARGSADQLEQILKDELSALSGRTDSLNQERRKKEEEARLARESEQRRKTVDAALADIDTFRKRNEWAQVAKLSLGLYDQFQALDPRARAVTVPIKVTTTPPGAQVAVVGGSSGRSPCIVEAPARQRIVIRISKPGFGGIETPLDTDSYHEIDLPLARGAAWRRDLGARVVGSLAAASAAGRGCVLAVAKDGHTVGLAAEDGRVLWERPAGLPDSADSLGEPAPPGIAQGVGIVGGHSGLLLGLDLATGAEVWRSKTDAPILHAPLVVDIEGRERAVVSRGTSLAVVNAAKGEVEREVWLPAAAASAPAARGSLAVAVLVDGRVAAIDLAKGKLAWTVDAKIDPVGPPVLAPELGLIFVASRDGTILALSPTDGSQVFRRSTELGTLEGGIALDEGKLVVGSARGRLAAFDASDGRPLWETQGPAALASPVRRFFASTYAPLKSGDLVELGPGDGRRRSSVLLEGAPSATPILSGSRLFLAAGNVVYGFEKPEED